MLLPRLFADEFFDDMMNDWSDHPMFGKHEKNWMKTDVVDNGSSYELDMDLPGFKKEDIKIELDQGYLTVSAAKSVDNDKQDDKGNYIRRERRVGSCSRSFFVGDNMTQEDVKASFSDGILHLTLPKKDAPQVENKKYISIE